MSDLSFYFTSPKQKGKEEPRDTHVASPRASRRATSVPGPGQQLSPRLQDCEPGSGPAAALLSSSSPTHMFELPPAALDGPAPPVSAAPVSAASDAADGADVRGVAAAIKGSSSRSLTIAVPATAPPAAPDQSSPKHQHVLATSRSLRRLSTEPHWPELGASPQSASRRFSSSVLRVQAQDQDVAGGSSSAAAPPPGQSPRESPPVTLQRTGSWNERRGITLARPSELVPSAPAAPAAPSRADPASTSSLTAFRRSSGVSVADGADAHPGPDPAPASRPGHGIDRARRRQH